MIISHKYKFIFIKTRKTAGTSIELFLSKLCSQKDIVTEIFPREPTHQARNFLGLNNPFEAAARQEPLLRRLRHAVGLRRFYNHMPAGLLRARVEADVWENYYKFCVERNPWDKTVSMYYMHLRQSGKKMSLERFIDTFPRLPKNFHLYCDSQDGILVDRILYYESLDAELGSVFKHLEIPYGGSLAERAKARYRASNRGYEDSYRSSSRERVAEIYREEIDLLGYDFS